MFGVKDLFPDLKGPEIERFGLFIAALFNVQHCQVVEHSRDFAMLRVKGHFFDLKGPDIKRFGLFIAALPAR